MRNRPTETRPIAGLKKEHRRETEARERRGRYHSSRGVAHELRHDPKASAELARRRADVHEGKNLVWPSEEEIEAGKNPDTD